MKKGFLFLIAASIFLSGCVITGFNTSFTPWYEANYFPEASYLKADEEPEIIAVTDLDTKFWELSSDWHRCIGYTQFNGTQFPIEEINASLRDLCKKNGAKIAIWTKDYTGTGISYNMVPYTSVHTVVSPFGSVSAYTTTNYTTQTYSTQRFDYCAYLFVSIPEENRIDYAPGFSISNLTNEDRNHYKQNTGCLINTVYNNTPAYYANLFHGDIITDINGTAIHSVDDYLNFIETANIGDTWNITVVRNGMEKTVQVPYRL